MSQIDEHGKNLWAIIDEHGHTVIQFFSHEKPVELIKLLS